MRPARTEGACMQGHKEYIHTEDTRSTHIPRTQGVHAYRGHKEYTHTEDTRSTCIPRTQGVHAYRGHKEYMHTEDTRSTCIPRTQGVQYVVQDTAKSHDDRPHQATGCILVKMLIRVDYTAGISVQQFCLVDPFPPISRHHTCRGYVCRQLSTIKMYVSMVFVW